MSIAMLKNLRLNNCVAENSEHFIVLYSIVVCSWAAIFDCLQSWMWSRPEKHSWLSSTALIVLCYIQYSVRPVVVCKMAFSWSNAKRKPNRNRNGSKLDCTLWLALGGCAWVWRLQLQQLQQEDSRSEWFARWRNLASRRSPDLICCFWVRRT